MFIFSSLKRDQKEAVGLLQIGTFLEYFDLMLYIHMAVLLNTLFFPKTDPKTSGILAAFAFCSTYVLRPVGALIFGYIGDHIGRKITVILTTMMMAVSCTIMATLPTYAEIGITASWVITLCRVVQSISSTGEIIGAELYVTEITKPPVQYPAVGLIGCACRLGTVVALGVALLVTSFGFNWRNGFWIGAAIAVVGSVARTRLRETPDFVDMKRRMKKIIEDAHRAGSGKEASLLQAQKILAGEKVHWTTFLAFFLVAAGAPISLYFNYIYCGEILKNLGFTPEAVIHQNFFVSIIEFLLMLCIVFLSYRINPLKILKFKGTLFLPFLFLCPFFLTTITDPSLVFFIQIMGVCLSLVTVPADAILFVHFPIFKRFTYSSMACALSRALMSIITAFGLVYLTDLLGYWGLYIVLFPVALGFLWGVRHFQKLEERKTPSF